MENLENLFKKFAEINKVEMDHNYAIDKEVKEIDKTERKISIEPPSKMSFLKKPVILLNLFVVIICYICVSFDSYLIGFHLKYLKGNLYVLAILSTVSDWLGNFVAGFIQKVLGTKKTLLFSYILAMIFGLPLILAPENKTLIPFSIFFSRFGLSVAFGMIYFVNPEVFPTLFVSFAFTVGNIFSRGATVLAPEVAEIEPPIPMRCFYILLILATIAVTFLNKQEEEEHAEPQELEQDKK